MIPRRLWTSFNNEILIGGHLNSLVATSSGKYLQGDE